MTRRFGHSFAGGVCTIACAVVAANFVSAPGAHILSTDQDGDGEPDIWRTEVAY